ncbi:MAG: heavy metal-associated domain-containing protein [Bacteroidia bacterium]
MKTEDITIANLKCNGCATTIKNELLKIIGVENVVVLIEESIVRVSYSDVTSRVSIIEKLHSLGYPEATENNGMLLQLKSYGSCAIGKINNL